MQLLGRYSVLYVLAVASTATFAYFLPHQIEKATLGGTRGGAKLLDKHIPTWTAQDADLLVCETTSAPALQSVAEALRRPCVTVAFQPLAPTAAFAHPLLPSARRWPGPDR